VVADDGDRVALADGLGPKDQVVRRPPASLSDGDEVEVSSQP
jgi:hypothetical protein